MAMVLTEGFDSYISTASLLNRFSPVDSDWAWQATEGRVGGPAVQAVGSVGGSILRLPSILPGLGTASGYAFWFKISAAPDAQSIFLRFKDTALANIWTLTVQATGAIAVSNANGATTVAITPFSCADDEWHYLEASRSTNSHTLCIDNETIGSGLTGGVEAAFFVEFVSILSRTITFDDFILYNGDTGYPDRDVDFPIGPQLIHTLRPVADASPVDFDRSDGGVNANLVNEVSLDTDDWVQSAVIGAQDLYEYSADFPDSPLPDRIHTAMVTSNLRNPDVGAVNFANLCNSGGSQTQGTTTGAPSQRRHFQSSYPVRPDGGADWEAATVNSALFGIKVVS